MKLAEIVRSIDGALAGETASPPESPWLAWLTLVLMRQRARQAWHRRIVETLPPRREQGHGRVPGQPGWRFRFHGNGCCLTGPGGELVDVDWHDDEAAIIDPWFFAARIASIRARDLPERRLWHWLPHRAALIAAIPDLRIAGIVEYPRGEHVFRLCDELEQRVARVVAVEFAAPAVAARWLAALGDRDTPPVRAAHHRWLSDRASTGTHAYKMLPTAARILPPDELLRVCETVMAGSIDAGAGQAVAELRVRFDPRAVPLVRRLFARVTTAELPFPAYQCLAFLLEHDPQTPDIRQRFIEFASVEVAAGFLGNPFLGRYAILALRHLPALALDLVRRALRSTTPAAVSDIATMLAAIGQPWCHRELAAALAQRADDTELAQANRLDPARALRELDRGERRVALALRQAYPPEWAG
ncbi:DUF6896 domain-containing protein [Nannocystis radixulma]|uniref:DUF6896 domain-containing protein n=1 Tax=Nannocystis radixulma TaxID=2995305 RepID=A0ABT5B9N6_9BACT|nr:hypothetical protein [Nannocystis radixulma]MDC0670330.1 hypothetical protein [Nannocystis radixulma]